MVQGIEHTAIASPDTERLARWYVDALGFVINYESPSSGTFFVKAPNGSMLEIIRSGYTSEGRPVLIQHMIRPGQGSRFIYHVSYPETDE